MVELAAMLTAVVAPYLPQLLALSSEMGKEALKKGVDQGFDSAKAIWDRLHPKLQEKEITREALQDAAIDPHDPDALAALRLQIRRILEQDVPLANELKSLVAAAQPGGVTVTVSGARSVAIGGNVSGSSITTGDQPRLPSAPEAKLSGD